MSAGNIIEASSAMVSSESEILLLNGTINEENPPTATSDYTSSPSNNNKIDVGEDKEENEDFNGGVTDIADADADAVDDDDADGSDVDGGEADDNNDVGTDNDDNADGGADGVADGGADDEIIHGADGGADGDDGAAAAATTTTGSGGDVDSAVDEDDKNYHAARIDISQRFLDGPGMVHSTFLAHTKLDLRPVNTEGVEYFFAATLLGQHNDEYIEFGDMFEDLVFQACAYSTELDDLQFIFIKQSWLEKCPMTDETNGNFTGTSGTVNYNV